MGTKLLLSTSHNPQTDGQTEVTNRNLGTLLIWLVNKTTMDWDIKLAHAEFAYNRTSSSTTGLSPFEVIYGINPYVHVVLILIVKKDILNFDAKSRQEAFYRTCEQVKMQIEKMNTIYKERANKKKQLVVFNPSDLVWLNLRKRKDFQT